MPKILKIGLLVAGANMIANLARQQGITLGNDLVDSLVLGGLAGTVLSTLIK